MVRVRTLGQLRVHGRAPNEFSTESERPKSFPRENQLLNQKKIRGLSPIDSVRPYPGSVQPPPIPQVTNEGARIREQEEIVMWPHTEPYTVPFDEITFKQPLSPKTSRALIRRRQRAIDRAAQGKTNMLTPIRGEWAGFAPGGPAVYQREEIPMPALSGVFDDPIEWLVGLLTPKNATGFILGGAALFAIAAMPRVKKSFAPPFLQGAGGILMGLGIVPLLLKATK